MMKYDCNIASGSLSSFFFCILVSMSSALLHCCFSSLCRAGQGGISGDTPCGRIFLRQKRKKRYSAQKTASAVDTQERTKKEIMPIVHIFRRVRNSADITGSKIKQEKGCGVAHPSRFTSDGNANRKNAVFWGVLRRACFYCTRCNLSIKSHYVCVTKCPKFLCCRDLSGVQKSMQGGRLT